MKRLEPQIRQRIAIGFRNEKYFVESDGTKYESQSLDVEILHHVKRTKSVVTGVLPNDQRGLLCFKLQGAALRGLCGAAVGNWGNWGIGYFESIESWLGGAVEPFEVTPRPKMYVFNSQNPKTRRAQYNHAS